MRRIGQLPRGTQEPVRLTRHQAGRTRGTPGLVFSSGEKWKQMQHFSLATLRNGWGRGALRSESKKRQSSWWKNLKSKWIRDS
uniref:Cytochrome P450 2C55-like isoform X2 n=1 Tax=Phascolarctos cinereus TaxID=38626 RepID=A0A6P5L3L2_PHACI|nr:cytochrome P450 2C55-like isoform X2 [Phascolarctos cinereus]